MNIIEFILSNKLENLEDLKIDGKISIKKEVVKKVLEEQNKVKPDNPEVPKPQPTKSENSLNPMQYYEILENMNLIDINVKSESGKVSLEFNIDKGKKPDNTTIEV